MHSAALTRAGPIRMGIFDTLPQVPVAFGLTALFGFVIGLELHSYRRSAGRDLGFGTTRTLTLLAVLGFVLALLDSGLRLYAVGLIAVAVLVALHYRSRLREGEQSLLPALIALLVYGIGPLALREPMWLLILYVVVVLLLLGEKPGIRRFSDAFRSHEATTLVKFLIMAGLILPVLPARQIAPFVTVTYYQVWLAVIVVSAISYLSYLAQSYFFPTRGALLTGVLGGLYSSTAATVVLGRRAHGAGEGARVTGAAIAVASAMMYLRLWVLIALLGHRITAERLAAPFAVLFLLLLGVAWWIYRGARREGAPAPSEAPRHPLEFSTAVLFAGLFVLFAGLTHFVVRGYGAGGLQVLSFGVGLTDIDPFILALLAGKFHVAEAALDAAVLIAAGSNNLLKAGYALGLSRNRAVAPAAAWLVGTFALSLIYVYWGLR